MTRQLHSSGSPYEPQAGFSRAVRQGDRIMVAGTAPIEPDGGTAVGDPAAQARRCLQIISEAIEALGGTMADVVRSRMYLTRAQDWPAVSAVHGEFYGDVRPAATCVVVAGLLDPDWLVEIEAEALLLKPDTPGSV